MPPNRSHTPGQGENDSESTPPPEQDHPAIDIVEVKLARRSGRGIRRLVTLCGTPTQLVAEYDRRLLESEPDGDGGNDGNSGDDDGDVDGDEHLTAENKEEIKRRRNREYQSYLKLIKLIPSLKERIADPREELRIIYYAQLVDGANNARSDDLSRVKSGVASLLNNRTNGAPNPPLDLDTRDGRGLQNDVTGRLLCPVIYDWDDPITRAKLRDGLDEHDAFDDYWIRCLYEGEKGDPEDVERGFLRGNLLIKTFQMIFTSPSSARGNLDAEETSEAQGRRRKAPSKRPSVAAQLRMNGQVTARAIAYAAVQLHFSLNDATHWMSDYNSFNYEEFYEFIIDFFEEDQTPEGKAAADELFNWWNQYVSGFSPTCVSTVCGHSRRLVQISEAVVTRTPATTAQSTPPKFLATDTNVE
ncbi:hypothetical protein BJ322DRAFT_1208558 [Thelephora terrestris]|uniref:Uncharacterized protein n=1 Tax=Thelephora terrestris TaxID=56493 RepID=A0A9P6L9Y8_9AGAM|nr:hypothetical protein BJ322DRAFT_1208558 [Thelephora terrestris]